MASTSRQVVTPTKPNKAIHPCTTLRVNASPNALDSTNPNYPSLALNLTSRREFTLKMLSLQATAPKKCTPNLLPLRINHNGPINDTQRYWTPESSEDGTHPSPNINSSIECNISWTELIRFAGTQHAYFRGRHLHGTPLALPENYTGAVMHGTEKVLPQSHTSKEQNEVDEEDMEKEGDVEVKIMEQVGSFDEVLVWGHGGKVDQSQDVYARGLGEWIEWAECMHGEDEEQEQGEGKEGKGAWGVLDGEYDTQGSKKES